MKTTREISYMNSKHAIYIAVAVCALLLVPLILTWTGSGVEGEGWYWTPRDFVFGFVMLFSTGLGLDYALRRFRTPLYRLIACGAIIFAFLVIWVQLAVGIFD